MAATNDIQTDGTGETDYRAAGALAAARGGFDIESVGLLQRAAEAGHARACFHLGLLHAKGDGGLAADAIQARHWCERAARLGLGVAQFNLGLLEAGATAGDAATAERWLLAAAANGISEADTCLDILYREPATDRPRTWEEAETRASIALERSDPAAPKTVRFAEYYVDPCLDLLARRFALRREQCEDIVQEFLVELEEPLSKGAQRGIPWKEALRRGFHPDTGFRPYLARALGNFARDWLRRERSQRQEVPPALPGSSAPVDIEQEHVRDAWRTELERFQADHAEAGEPAARPTCILVDLLTHGDGLECQAQRIGLTERTVRRDLAIATGLLQRWVLRQIDSLREDDPMLAGLRQGADLIPTWMHRCGSDKRRRLLCYLALLNHRRPSRQ